MLKLILKDYGYNLRDKLYSMATENSIIIEPELTPLEVVKRVKYNKCNPIAAVHPRVLHDYLNDNHNDIDYIIISLFTDDVIKHVDLEKLRDKNIIIGARKDSNGNMPKKLLDYIHNGKYFTLLHHNNDEYEYVDITQEIDLGGKENAKR